MRSVGQVDFELTGQEQHDRLEGVEEERKRLANNPPKCDNESRKSRIEVSILGHPGDYGRSGRRRPKKQSLLTG